MNFLHHHAENEHELAMQTHAEKEQHHCELDDYFCQTTNEASCEHPLHIAAALTKCFSCDFHFIKHYQITDFFSPVYKPLTFNLLQGNEVNLLLDALVFISNKGPPANLSL